MGPYQALVLTLENTQDVLLQIDERVGQASPETPLTVQLQTWVWPPGRRLSAVAVEQPLLCPMARPPCMPFLRTSNDGAVRALFRKHRNFGLGVLVVGGFHRVSGVLAEDRRPRCALSTKEERVVQASVDDKRTLHGQVDELKGKVEQLVANLTDMTKHLKGLQGELADSKEARLREQEDVEA